MNWWTRRSKLGKLGITAAVFVVLIIALTSGNDDPAPTQAADVTTTTEAVAVTTTVETAPTTTAAPTTTVTKPSEDPAAVAYTTDLQPVMDSVGSSLSDIGELGPRWPGWTDEEQMRFIVALAVMQTMESQVQALSPPPSMMPVHEKMLDAAAHMKKSAQLIARGIDNVDTDTMNEGTAELLEANAAIQEATALITSLE
jgi:hypothetical protein